jgi:glutamine synthetase
MRLPRPAPRLGYSASPESKRLDFRPPDPSANPYLAFSALMMAGLDGIQNSIDPGPPFDVDVFVLYEDELEGIDHVPGSLDEALAALQADREFLLQGGVFNEALIDTWIAYKRKQKADQVRMRPHPWEFVLYYDA